MPIQKSVLQTSLYVTSVSAGFLIGSANLQAVPHHNGRMKHSEQALMGPHCWRKLWKSLTRIFFTCHQNIQLSFVEIEKPQE
jgi:hypothetical protein